MADPTQAAPAAAAPAAAPATESVIAPAAPAAAPAQESVIANVAAAPAAAAVAAAAAPKAGDPPAAPSADDMKKFLTDNGTTAEDLAKIPADGLEKAYTTAKAAADHKALLASIEVTVPEGIKIEDAQLNGFKEIIADAKLSPKERAQKLIDLHGSALKSAAEAPYNAWAKTQGEWQAQIKGDAELGGANFDKVRATIAKAITDVGGKEADKAFEAFLFTGAGNHPEIVRLLYRMASQITEGDHVSGGNPASSGQDERVLTAMYPSASKAR